jgi:hypothetical protein
MFSSILSVLMLLGTPATIVNNIWMKAFIRKNICFLYTQIHSQPKDLSKEQLSSQNNYIKMKFNLINLWKEIVSL